MNTPLPTGLQDYLEHARKQLRMATPVDTAAHVCPDELTAPDAGRQQVRSQLKQLLSALDEMSGDVKMPLPTYLTTLTDDGLDEVYVRSDQADHPDLVKALAYQVVRTTILRKMAAESALIATGLLVRLESTSESTSDQVDSEVVA